MRTLTLALALGLTSAFFAAIHKKVRDREAHIGEPDAEAQALDDTDLVASTRPTFPPVEPEVR